MKQNKGIRRRSALLAALALLALSGCRGADSEERQTLTPDIGTIENRVEDTGVAAYEDPVSIIPVVSGKILSCAVEEGDTVTAGQTLYVIDSRDLEDQIAQGEVSLRTASASLSQAQAACDDLTVRASAAGTVTAVYFHVGDYVSAGVQMADLVDSSRLLLTVPFSQADAAALSPGDAATISFASTAGTVSGSVSRVYDTPTVLSGGRSGVYVEIAFQNPGAVAAGAVAFASAGGASCLESGAVRYAVEQSIYASQSGQVQSALVEEGDTVVSGQAIALLKNDSLTNAAANAQLSLESAQLNLSQLEARREDYTITAPADGVILSRSAQAGDYAAAATPLATLAQAGALYVTVDIDELYIDRVQPGQEASVTFTDDSGQQRLYAGRVRRVDDSGVTSGGVTDYEVEVELEDTEGLKAGMNVSVSILTTYKENCLRLPIQAVENGTVRLLRDGREETVSVTVGVSGGGYIEIVEGLSVDDTVILP